MDKPSEMPRNAQVVLRRKLLHLREVSPIAWSFERFFYGLSRLSPERFIALSRVDIQNRHQDFEARQQASRRRGRIIELYLVLWYLLETLVILALWLKPTGWMVALGLTLMLVRILDILQITVNIAIFDRMRLLWRDHYHESVPRSLILSVLNYIELMVCFGALYMGLSTMNQLIGAVSTLDAFYYSAVTQLTIGYGDIKPHGFAKVVSVCQGFISYLFTILILSRMVNMLPEIQSDDPQDR